MPDPSTLRDSTQIVLSSDALAEFRAELDERFTLTFFELNDGAGSGGSEGGGATGDETGSGGMAGDDIEDDRTDGDETAGNGTERDESEAESDEPSEYVCIIGSPVEIKAATEFLSRHGVRLR
jgi:hypothetical protein